MPHTIPQARYCLPCRARQSPCQRTHWRRRTPLQARLDRSMVQLTCPPMISYVEEGRAPHSCNRHTVGSARQIRQSLAAHYDPWQYHPAAKYGIPSRAQHPRYPRVEGRSGSTNLRAKQSRLIPTPTMLLLRMTLIPMTFPTSTASRSMLQTAHQDHPFVDQEARLSAREAPPG